MRFVDPTDAAGHRVAKGTISLVGGQLSCDPTANGFTATSVYVIGPGGEEMTEVDNSGNWIHTNVAKIATYDSQGVHFHIYDWLGTRRMQTDYAGVPQASFPSLPFGDCVDPTALTPVTNCPDSLADASDHHFTGKEHDTESGFDYFGARYYASGAGRWMSPDWSEAPTPVPFAILTNPQTLNLYNYAQSNPLTVTDLDGHLSDPTTNTTSIDKLSTELDSLYFNGMEADDCPICDKIANYLVPPPPPPPPPSAPGIATLDTDIKGNTTTLQTIDSKGKYESTTIATHVVVTHDSAPDAGGPIESTVVGVSNKHAGEIAYGPAGALIDVGDSRNRYIHGGGSKFGNPGAFADHQGWAPTEGCTRGQNIDVISLGSKISDFQRNNPQSFISYTRQ